MVLRSEAASEDEISCALQAFCETQASLLITKTIINAVSRSSMVTRIDRDTIHSFFGKPSFAAGNKQSSHSAPPKMWRNDERYDRSSKIATVERRRYRKPYHPCNIISLDRHKGHIVIELSQRIHPERHFIERSRITQFTHQQCQLWKIGLYSNSRFHSDDHHICIKETARL